MLGIQSNIHDTLIGRLDCEDELKNLFDIKMKAMYNENYAMKFSNNIAQEVNQMDGASEAEEEVEGQYKEQDSRDRFGGMSSFYEKVPDDTQELRKRMFWEQTSWLRRIKTKRITRGEYKIGQKDEFYNPYLDHVEKQKRQLANHSGNIFDKFGINQLDRKNLTEDEYDEKLVEILRKIRLENPEKYQKFLNKLDKIDTKYQNSKLSYQG